MDGAQFCQLLHLREWARNSSDLNRCWHECAGPIAAHEEPTVRTQVQSPARTCRFEVLESRRVLAVGIGLSGVHGPPAVRSIVAPAPAPTSAAVLGDFNLDGRLSANDLTAALSALTDISGYVAAHQLSENDLLSIGDINHDYGHVVGYASIIIS